MDDSNLSTKLQAFQEVEKMFKTEVDILQDMVKSGSAEADKSGNMNRKIVNVKNLSKTMSDLIKNIVQEVDTSREEMFKILESIAVIEINKGSKKFNANKAKSY